MIRKLFMRLLAPVLAAGMVLTAAGPAWATGADKGLDLTEAEQAYVESAGPLKVGYIQDRIPITFMDDSGQCAGISRYIFDRVAELSGLTFEYAPLPMGDVTYDYLLGEGYDLVTSVEYNKENQKARGILISDPYLSTRKVVVARDDRDFSYGAELSVAISSGSQTIRKVLTDAYPNFTPVNYESIPACFEAVLSGEADLMIQNQYVVEYWFAKPSYEQLKVIPMLDMDDELCFSAVVSFDGQPGPTQEEGRVLIDILDKAISRLTEDEIGSYIIQATMACQYELDLGDFIYRYRLAVGVLTAAGLVILTLAVLLTRQRVRSVQARADAKAKGEFLSAMSHELRTPLNGLIGLNYLMEQKLDEPEKLSGYLRQSSSTAKYLLSLVNDILDMSYLQDGKLELEDRPVDLELLAATTDTIVRGAMDEKGLEFQTDISLPCPLVMGDMSRIQQVILNLLDNARKFTPSGGHVSFRMEQSLTEGGPVVTRALVTDDGQGMSEDFQKYVFDSFAKEQTTVSTGDQGTGLGLPISSRLARMMGGELTFTSQKGEGSQFIFSFPARPADSPRQAQASRSGRGRSILVAEDNELNREIMSELLESEGFSPVVAKNGREAVDAFLSAPAGAFDTVLMDLLMPEMDGFAAAEAIRASGRPDAKTVKIIACTANSSAEDRAQARAVGMDGFLAKPVDVDELLAALGAP